jgi:predicted HTH transcriptional regulator
VWFFDDRMEVLSLGELQPPVTWEQLRQTRRVHAPRNRLLVRVLASVGIIRDEGEGFLILEGERRGACYRPGHPLKVG